AANHVGPAVRMRRVEHDEVPLDSQFVDDVRTDAIAQIMRQADEIKRNEDKAGAFGIFEIQDLREEWIKDFVGEGAGSATATQTDSERGGDFNFCPAGKAAWVGSGGGAKFARGCNEKDEGQS